MFDKRVVALDIASIVAGTKYRGQFEERMKAILNELAKNKNIILFIDEIHTIVGAGGSGGSLDAANMLKPALSRGEDSVYRGDDPRRIPAEYRERRCFGKTLPESIGRTDFFR